MDELCARIRKVRKDWNITQVEFAKRLGVTNAHISAIEKGKTVPSQALVKLICKEFKVNERWLLNGEGPQDTEELMCETEIIIDDVVTRLNKIRTRDNWPIRSRVIQLEELFVNIIDIGQSSEEIQIKYFDICYKLFYHINAYLTFQKNSFDQGQLHLFPFPDDLVSNLQKDISEFENFFKTHSKGQDE